MTKERLQLNNNKSSLMVKGLYLIFLILVFSITGYTFAWFVSGDDTDNTFTAGTLLIEASGSDATPELSKGDCVQLNYTISNTGSKSSYVRARFEGIWRRSFHRNTATAKVFYNNERITATDSAYYKYGDFVYDPYTDTGSNPDPVGFTGKIDLPPLVFPALDLHQAGSLVFADNMLEKDSLTNGQEESVFSLAVATSGYPIPCTGPKVEPLNVSEMETAYPDIVFGPGNNAPSKENVQQVLGPQDCMHFFSVKVDDDQDSIEELYTDGSTNFNVKIYKETDGDKSYFAFVSNYPVYHLYAKGGNQGGNFYKYYDTYEDGVTEDCGLSQPGGNWSNITFYYCVPPDDPALTIIKQVSVDGGSTWFDADTLSEAPVVDPNYDPQFKFVVENTGNVTLTGIEVTDDYFGSIGTISSLAPGAKWELIKIDENWKQNQVLSTENVSIKLCNNMTSWLPHGPQPLGTYFYYNTILASGGSIPLCIQVCLDADKTGSEYDSAVFTIYAYFDAVQASNNIIDINWPGHPVNGN